MQIDVFFGVSGLAPADLQGRAVAVIDVLRASTTIATALDNGARAVIPFESSEEAVTRAKTLDRSDVRLAGERKMLPIPGFDLGNSPAEFTRGAVEGKTVLMSTTNGTRALTAVQGARDVIVASYVNFSAALALLRSALRGGADVALICAGRDRQFALEDAACAGLFIQHITTKHTKAEINDAALSAMLVDKKFGTNYKRLLRTATHGAALIEAGFERDIEVCADLDAYPVVPVYQDRQITKVGPERER